ncbi:hypothetical protein PGT21_000086 [Puccinia graminis f. sp. tritici]|uniref:C2H2-type domain-containing protein n=1 Tax=Puccinia graminis f. sp. tritici TaxID=56615 RepID=A0A5B0MCL0_PUCGR|nr:hypothetical protein PGT21_000086 [Puccinia graminis f. sp. tritici]
MQQPTSSPVNTHPPSSQHQCLKDGCMEVFANFGELRKHIRNVHQHSATCMTHSKKQVTIFRSSEGKFGCPNKGCDYTAGPPINIQNHLKLCDPEALNPPRAMPIPPTGSVTVVPLVTKSWFLEVGWKDYCETRFVQHLRTDHIKFFSVLYRQPSPEIICSSHLGSGNEIQAEGSILWDKLSQELSVLDVLWGKDPFWNEEGPCFSNSADLYKEIDVSQKSAALVPLSMHGWPVGCLRLTDTHFGLRKLAIKNQSTCLSGENPIRTTTIRLLDEVMFNFISFSCFNVEYQSRIQSALEQFVSLAMLNEDGSCMPPLHLCHTIAVCNMESAWGYVSLACGGQDQLYRPTTSQMTMRDWMRLASSAVLNQQQPNATVGKIWEWTKLVIGSTAVHLTGIRTALRAALTLLRTLMQSILKGCSLPDCLVSTLEDKSENLSTGYNYMEERNRKQFLMIG